MKITGREFSYLITGTPSTVPAVVNSEKSKKKEGFTPGTLTSLKKFVSSTISIRSTVYIAKSESLGTRASGEETMCTLCSRLS